MKKLEKYLSKESSKTIVASTTFSTYYQLGNCKIRVSDHYSSDTNADLCITYPENGGRKYLVSAKNSSKFYLWNTKEIMEFIPHLITYCNLITKNVKQNEEEQIKISKIVSKLSNLPKDLGKIQCRPRSDFWKDNEFEGLRILFSRELETNVTSLPLEFKTFLKSHCCGYVKALNLYKIAYIDNTTIEQTPELLSEIFVRI